MHAYITETFSIKFHVIRYSHGPNTCTPLSGAGAFHTAQYSTGYDEEQPNMTSPAGEISELLLPPPSTTAVRNV